MQFTFLGHASFLVETRGKRLLFDPYITPNEKARDINLDDLKPDVILISHAHGDHVADVETIASATGATLISNFEIVTYYGERGLSGHPLNHGGKANFPFGTVKYVQAVHSSVFPDGSYGGNPGGFVIWNDESCFYYAGDTALTTDMSLIPQTCPPLDFAVLPIGDNFTMGYEDAVQAADLIACDKIIGCHYDTFGYIEIDHAAAQDAFRTAGKELLLPGIGETIAL